MNLLHVCANPKPMEEAISKQLASAFFGKLIELKPDVELVNLDLYDEKPPFCSYELFKRAWYPVFNDEYEPSKAEEMSTNYANEQAEKFNNADVLVLTMPMWNYSTPAIMKAWIDQLLLPGVTFNISKNGIESFHKIKRIVLLVSSGGVYKEGDDKDALSRQIRHSFGLVGITEIDVVWAEGQNTLFFQNSEENKSVAIEAAIEAAEDIAELEV